MTGKKIKQTDDSIKDLRWWWWRQAVHLPLGCILWCTGARWSWQNLQDRQCLTFWHRLQQHSPDGYLPGSHETHSHHHLYHTSENVNTHWIYYWRDSHWKIWWCRIPFWRGWWCLRRGCSQPTPLSQCKWLQELSPLALQLQQVPYNHDSPLPETQRWRWVTEKIVKHGEIDYLFSLLLIVFCNALFSTCNTCQNCVFFLLYLIFKGWKKIII